MSCDVRRAAAVVFVLAWLAGSAVDAAPASRRIVVDKSARTLQLSLGDRIEASYRVGLGLDPVSRKRKEGDRATPEGNYFVCARQPHSAFFVALVISYPNAEDAAIALRERRIDRRQYRRIAAAIAAGRCPPFDTPLGGWVEIHGSGSASDWTWGCIALDNSDMRAVFDRVPVGTPVLIQP